MQTIASLLTIAATFYVLLGLMLYFMQERMVFLARMAGRALEATPRHVGFDYDDVTVRTSDGVSLHGWYVPTADRRGTVLTRMPKRPGSTSIPNAVPTLQRS